MRQYAINGRIRYNLTLAAACICMLFAIALLGEFQACLNPESFSMRVGCWEGSCWSRSIDPMAGVNSAHRTLMLAVDVLGFFLATALALRFESAIDRADRLQGAIAQRGARAAARRPEVLRARLRVVEDSMRRLQLERSELACRLTSAVAHARCGDSL